jgi:hypothetical protein
MIDVIRISNQQSLVGIEIGAANNTASGNVGDGKRLVPGRSDHYQCFSCVI